MLKNLFRPKWQHDNPAVRKEAITRLASHELPVLLQISMGDKDSHLRQLAISKINDLETLLQINRESVFGNDQEFALKCWVGVLTSGEQLSPLATEQQVLDCQNEKLLAAIMAYSDNSSLRDLALSGIKSEERLLALMSNTKNGRVWQKIIERLQSEPALKQAAEIVNGRDKKSQQAIKTRLDAIKTEQLGLQQQLEKAEQLIARLRHLLQAESNPQFEGILITARQQWQSMVNSIGSNSSATIQALIEECEKRLHDTQQKKAADACQQEQQTQAQNEQNKVLQQLAELAITALEGNETVENTSSTLTTIIKHWHATPSADNNSTQHAFNKHVATVNAILQAREMFSRQNLAEKLGGKKLHELAYEDISRSIEQLQSIIGLLPKDNTLQNSAFSRQLQSLQQVAHQHLQSLREKTHTLHQNINKNLLEAESFIEKRELKNAQKAFTDVRKLLAQLPDKESRQYNNASQRIIKNIKTLEDWKNFAGDEKRAELCTKMKNLISNSPDLQVRADNIKLLQQQWKALGHCHNQALWDEFKAYADEAYAPCQAFFDAQKKIRRFNAAQRTTICEQLEQFLQNQDWATADWKALERLHKAVQDEWKKYSPVAREDHQQLQERFFNSVNMLKDTINNERKRNHDKLAALIVEAQQLLQTDNIQDALDRYNALQQQWKTVGITFYKEQHEQWQAFKKAGDALYEKRQNIRHEADHQRQANLASARKICSDIVSLSQLDDDELSRSRADFEALKTEFKACGSLPKDQYNACMQAFNKACESYEKNIASIHQRGQHKLFTLLETLGNEWLQLEAADEKPDFNSLHSALPEKWLKQLAQRFSTAAINNPSEHARTLCIEMEVLAGVDTPAEDSALKMQWQMSRLAKNFGQLQTHTDSDLLEDLYLRWFSQKCWNTTEYCALTQRFLNAAKKLLATQ